jgi:Holliday junction resolvasome RuvABC endonuclease subunit
MSVIVGIDYSMTSPGVVCYKGSSSSSEWDHSQCHFWAFMTPSKIAKIEQKSSLPDFISLLSYTSDQFSSDFVRFNYLADAVCRNIIDVYCPDTIIMEGYSFGSTGARLFNLIENTAVLKQKIQIERGLSMDLVPPSAVKKFATSKGNANKDQMEQSFINETGVSFRDILLQSPKQYNPSSDLIDAYYICKYGFEKQKMMHQSV